MVEIIKILGTPTREEICNMNRNLGRQSFLVVRVQLLTRRSAEFKFPLVLQHSWVKGNMLTLVVLSVEAIVTYFLPLVFRDKAPSDCVDLMSKLLLYDPRKRYSPMQVVKASSRMFLTSSPYQACAHDCFDDLREGSSLLPDGRPIPAR